jgi:hypothetical protein
MNENVKTYMKKNKNKNSLQIIKTKKISVNLCNLWFK